MQSGTDDGIAGVLRRAGIDQDSATRMAAEVHAGAEIDTVLRDAFSRLEPAAPPPRHGGSLLVVVGDGLPARRLGAAVADEMEIDPAKVPFASRHVDAHRVATGALLLRSAEDAAERGPGWRRSRPAVVVVDAPVTGAERSWAVHVIAALRPTAVWGVVDATSKTEDIAAWATAVGGVDALALDGVEATASPAAALGVGIPVARLDGQPATAARWTATVAKLIRSCP